MTRGGNPRYKVHYIGWDPKWDEWLPPKDIDKEAIEEWEANPSATAATIFQSTAPEPRRILERPVIYISRVTKAYEQHYESTELEMSCLAWAFSKCDHLLEGSDVTIYTDHEAIKGVLSSAPGTRYSMRIDKPRMALMPFLDRITVVYMPGEQMKMVDPLSRERYQNLTPGKASNVSGMGRNTKSEAIIEESSTVIEESGGDKEVGASEETSITSAGADEAGRRSGAMVKAGDPDEQRGSRL